MPMYEVTFNGDALGGVAIVKANSQEEAIELIRSHPDYPHIGDPDEAIDVSQRLPMDGVIWFWDGDY